MIDRFDCSFRPSSPGFPSFAVGKKGKDRESGDIGSKRGKGERKTLLLATEPLTEEMIRQEPFL